MKWKPPTPDSLARPECKELAAVNVSHKFFICPSCGRGGVEVGGRLGRYARRSVSGSVGKRVIA